MNAPDHSLLPHHPATAKRARRWLLLGVIALGAAGIFAGLLANTKSPYFYTALVVHVDLSVLVWFLTMACMFFTLAGQERGWNLLSDAAFASFACGTLLLALSAVTGGEPYMSNYVPVIHHPVFFMALGLILCGTLAQTVNLCIAFSGWQVKTLAQYGVYWAGLALLLATAAFLWSGHSVPGDIHGQVYYEYLFWDGGHVLQFVHTQLMVVCWLWLASAAGFKWHISDSVTRLLFRLGPAIAACCMLYAYDRTPGIISDEHRNAFTHLMRDMNGLVPLVTGGFILYAFMVPARARITLPKICLFMSILLFTGGGMLGYAIAGSNVTVPAHYHGSIVGITLAFMGVSYLLLPSFGWADVRRSKLAFWQPVIYGGGQLCWMAGMAILGAHGVPRKTPGSADTVGAFASFLKHGGDGLALIGGLLFVFIVLRAVWKRDDPIR